MKIERQQADEEKRGYEWGLRALEGNVENAHLPHAGGRVVEKLIFDAGWKRVNDDWKIKRKTWDPVSKYKRDLHIITYHSPNERFKVSVTYIVGTQPAMCKCAFRELKDK